MTWPRSRQHGFRPNLMLGLPNCFGSGGARIDAAVAAGLVWAVEPRAVEAALQARRMHMESQTGRSRIAELELQQARYEAALAERRYAACDPDNRLIAAQLEKNWEAALRRVEACQARLDAGRVPGAPYQIRAADLKTDQVAAALKQRTRPCRSEQQNQLPMFTDT